MLRNLRDMIDTLRRARKKDRVVLVKTLFKTIAHQTDYLATGKRVLWIGVCRVTHPYYKKLQAQGATVWTIDLDPALTEFGNGTNHVVGNATMLEATYEAGFFDIVFCNGVIGWGVNSDTDQATCYASMAKVMKPGSLLVLGWNTHKTRDPRVTKFFGSHFAPSDLPGFGTRMVVQGTTHVFDIFTRS